MGGTSYPAGLSDLVFCKAHQTFCFMALISPILAYQAIWRVGYCFPWILLAALKDDTNWLLILLSLGWWNPGLHLLGQRRHLQRVGAVPWWGHDDSGTAGGAPWVWHGQCHWERPELRGLRRVSGRGEGWHAWCPVSAWWQVSGGFAPWQPCFLSHM